MDLVLIRIKWQEILENCILRYSLLTFNVPMFKWPESISGPDLNARIRAAGACFY
jgi:hypothetical protein